MTDASKSPIDRIAELSALARTAWFSLLGCLAFVSVTLLSMRHADVLLDSRSIKLPVVAVEVPSLMFLGLAPIVTTVLYVNLHLYLTKLWKAFKDAPTDAQLAAGAPASGPEDDPYLPQLANFVPPWLVNDYALHLKQGTECRDHTRTWLRNVLTLFTCWWAAPIVLAWIWCKSLVAREPFVTAVILGCFLLTVAMGAHSWRQAQRRLALEPTGRLVQPLTLVLVLLACVAAAASLDASGALALRHLDLRHPIHLDHQNLAGLASDWEGADAQRADFRKVWCANENVPAAICGYVPGEARQTNGLILARRVYCMDGARIGARHCSDFFARLDRRFDTAWAGVRRQRLNQLARPDLSYRDLAGTSAVDVKLVGARLEGADLSGAVLREGLFEGALLKSANLTAAQAFFADFSLANLTWAALDRANLESSDLEGAALLGARLRGAKLSHANLVAADLSGADLRGADLKAALLYRTRLDGAILAGADLRGAVGLTPAQLATAVGNADTRFSAAGLVTETPLVAQPVLQVATCWEHRPKPLDTLLGNPWLSRDDRADIERFMCGREPARRAGVNRPPPRPPAEPRAPVASEPGPEVLLPASESADKWDVFVK